MDRCLHRPLYSSAHKERCVAGSAPRPAETARLSKDSKTRGALRKAHKIVSATQVMLSRSTSLTLYKTTAGSNCKLRISDIADALTRPVLTV